MNDLIDFTPALRAQAIENLKKYRWETIAVRSADRSEQQRSSWRDQHR